jgi:cytochrome bd-type quinol oxidase subunit 2
MHPLGLFNRKPQTLNRSTQIFTSKRSQHSSSNEQGAVFLQMGTGGEINTRAKKAVLIFGLVFMAAFAVAGIWQAFGIDGYRIVSMPDPGTASGPLAKKWKWLQAH